MKNFILLSSILLISFSCKKKSVEPEPITPQPITEVGANFQGGIVVYVDETGQHGLIITDFDVDTCEWSNGPMTYTPPEPNSYFDQYGISEIDLGAGKYNTQIIVNAFGNNGVDYAAQVCADLVHGGYSDWFLPSNAELVKACYSAVFPWSSHSDANAQGFYWTSNGGQSGGGYASTHRLFHWGTDVSNYPIFGQSSNPHKVRAMREF